MLLAIYFSVLVLLIKATSGLRCYDCQDRVINGSHVDPTCVNPTGLNSSRICYNGELYCITTTSQYQNTITRNCSASKSTSECRDVVGYRTCVTSCQTDLCNNFTVAVPNSLVISICCIILVMSETLRW
uniref:Uncharacterized LOC101242311 n=1 Tax=Ciona intestinalis TaxID=7719 RepID=F7A7S9_CIOIN|nr:uncharacterized protein LOC101242311 [Ciona intestinalis]|eukprot:XP_004226736.1 uncharacterized protein LOC101242311 [Ciona intestinalis]